MYQVKTEVKIIPDGFEAVNDFFHDHVFRSYIELGARLVGRWVDEDYTQITEIWDFQDREHYQQFFNLRKETSHYKNSRLQKIANDKWIISKKETHMMPTGNYFQPQHSVSASVYVQNAEGETLLVRSLHRSDTLEMPGGAMDKEESLVDCAVREVKEETGLDVEIKGLLCITQNLSSGVINFSFHGEVIGGELADCEGETQDVGFYDLSDTQLHVHVTYPHFKERILECSKLNYLPLDMYQVRPYDLTQRLNGAQS
ncbi:NUDIX domain-containing protein [Macrococcus brunensis]|uniref:NUDIX domain-containing protein n=1 Tax=Macrococcus brunensis TaxID=198483 RepID=A0A4R6BEL0_9STAP|nr:NUDIX domain-containing protein [Macrococcus brunensis]TDL98260.1 NUDIX domain-containing protein [Macrococcus brunensis]